MKLFFKKLSDDLIDLLRNEEDYNVLIEVGEASNCQIFKVHSVILNSRCSYFRNELSKINFDENNVKKISKPHVSVDVFKIIIDYIYGGFVRYEKVDASTIFDLLSTANQFGLNELVDTSQTQLIKNHKSWINLNFAKVYKTSLESDNFKVLQQYCNEIIVKNPSFLFDSKDFTNLSEKALITVLKLEAVHTNEGKIWEQIIKWGIAQNSGLDSDPGRWSDENFLILKSTLKNCLPYIQYSQITEDFMNKLCPYQQIFESNLWRDIETQNKTVDSTSQVTSATTISSSKNTAITDENKNNDSPMLFQNNSTVISKEKNEMKNENSATSTIMSTTSIATSTTSTTTLATSYGSTSLPENEYPITSQSITNVDNYYNYDNYDSAGRSVTCDICGEEGHDRSTCSYNSAITCADYGEEDHNTRTYSHGTRTITCGNCGREGHNARTCNYTNRVITCGNCGGEGHNARTCSYTNKVITCGNCGEEGHNARTCSYTNRVITCGNCGREGHNVRTCSYTNRVITCGNCGSEGHNARTCSQKHR